MKLLLVALTSKCLLSNAILTPQAVGNALFGLQNMNSDSVEVRNLLVVLTLKVLECTDVLDARAVSR